LASRSDPLRLRFQWSSRRQPKIGAHASIALHVGVMSCAGLRMGEILGVRWGLIAWATRTLFLDEESNRPRGGKRSSPKGGRVREVAISNHLLEALADLYSPRFKPAPDELVLKGIDPWNFRKRAWRRILEREGIGHRSIKDLRDTYALQLLTAGVQLGYISVQLGHADPNMTAKHYARWIPR